MREKNVIEPGEIKLLASLKKSNLKTWLGIFLVIASVALFSACAPTGDDAEPTTPPVTTTPTEPTTPPPPPEPTDLEVAQKQASDAADAAKTAADAAQDAADEAVMAGENLATLQTGDADYKKYRDAAKAAADEAMTAYMEAKKQSEAADAATDLVDALTASINAKTEQGKAEKARETAVENSDKAKMVDALLMIVDTMKSVGNSSVDTTSGYYEETVGGNTMKTGLMKDMNPKASGGPNVGTEGLWAQDNPGTTPDEGVAPVLTAEAKSFEIGKTLDSSDDMARLMLITSYVGSTTVGVFAYDEGADAATRVTGTEMGKVQVEGADTADNADDDVFANLKAKGMYYLAGAVADTDGITDATTGTVSTDTVAMDAKAEMVYSYTTGTGDTAATHYVVLQQELKTSSGTTYTYRSVDITATLPAIAQADIPGRTTEQGDLAAKEVEVTAKIPTASDYEHIQFGVWVGLGDAEKDGSQEIDDLGIGFVQNFSGGGMTGDDMPNSGEATYMGDWAAAVRLANMEGNGDISLRNGTATLTALFEKGEITVDLMNLAMLKGSITGNEFSGDTASDVDNMYGLDSNGSFTGTFDGGFYGSKAVEAGGVFNFTSTGMKAGEFRGAFGGRKQQ